MVKTSMSFMAGCVLFFQLSHIPHDNWLWATIPALLLLLHQHTRIIAFILLGCLWALLQTSLFLKHSLPSELEGKDIVISGVIIDLPQHSTNKVRFKFKLDPHNNHSLPKTIRLNWYYSKQDPVQAGERWQLTVRLKRPNGMSNPGSFDYEGWLFQQQIAATGYVKQSQYNQRLSSPPPYAINSLRQSIVSRLESHLSESSQLGLIQGLTTGFRDNISTAQWQVLRSTGTSHLLAISGLHIGLAAAIGFFLFKTLWSMRAKNLLLLPAVEFAVIGGFLVALFYAGLAGFSIPTQRALLMLATVMIAVLIRRPIAPSVILASSLLIILLVDPFAVLSAGFWLSFSAVGLILFVSLNRLPSPRWQWLKIHGLIALGLSPLLLLFFQQTSIISPLANLVAIPFISLIIVPILLLASFMLSIFEPLALILFSCADSLLGYFWPFLQTLSSLEFASWSPKALPFYYYISISLGCLMLLAPRGFPAKWLGIIGLSPLLLFSPNKPDTGEFWFTLLDVGQGLSAVIQTNSHTLVFDAGPKFSDSFNTGTAIVQPFLHHQGLSYIDTLIISHADNDHFGGALALINAMPVNNILSSVPELLPDALPCYSGQSWQWDQVSFEILHPQLDDAGSKNDLSCVIKVSNQSGSVLLTGDIERSTEMLLIQRYADKLKSTLLVAPHHGSNTSSSSLFINSVSPEWVLFPIGYKNRYHFPNPKVLSRYQQQNITRFSTAESGAIGLHFGIESILGPIAWRQKHQKMKLRSN
ncbi:MAG: DNA internalization-related competence protein ComEC/Rec2 [Gammaproteobacteria bacterium]|nr:MAG: DNA internalization-related competence protein ComEC/Rec2 [Gammaproteobacteria bacterium]